MVKENVNGLSPAQTERLAILAEEASEVIQMVGKILRHGYESCHPESIAAGVPVTNRQRLESELGDLLFAIEMSVLSGDVVGEKVIIAKELKADRIDNHLHYNSTLDFYVAEDGYIEDEQFEDGE